MIEVVSALLIREGRVLLTQKPATSKHCPYLWETPGGKAKWKETDHEALRRELWEELGLVTNVLSKQPIVNNMFPAGQPLPEMFLFKLYLASDFNDPRPLEGQGLGWFTPDEMEHLSFTPGTQASFAKIVEVVKAIVENTR